MCSCTKFAFEGQNAEKTDFSVKCCLLAFNIVALGLVVSLEVFVSRPYVASYHAYHVYPRPVFSSEKPVALLRESYKFQWRGSYVSSIDLVKLMFLEFNE